jgi:ribosomal 50S subunit-associated protein YjgA (DUF615 family)
MSDKVEEVTCAGCGWPKPVDKVTVITHPQSWPKARRVEHVCDKCWDFTAAAVETWVREHPDQDRKHLHDIQRRASKERSHE